MASVKSYLCLINRFFIVYYIYMLKISYLPVNSIFYYQYKAGSQRRVIAAKAVFFVVVIKLFVNMISLELELQNEVLFYELYNQIQPQVVLNTQLF